MPDYLSPFYILNIILCLIYPFIRNYGQTFLLNVKDTWGFKKENTVVTGVAMILIIRYVKYFSNWKKFIHECFFYSKCGISVLTLMIDYKLSLWYMFFCIVVWLLFKPPRFTGKSNIMYIPNEEIFNQLIGERKGKKDNIYFVVFYSNYSDDCLYTEEIFAKLSLKYSNKNFSFAKVDVDVCSSLAKTYNITISGFRITLPYVIVFVNGTEYARYPGNDRNGVQIKLKCVREKDLIKYLNLDELSERSK